MRYFGQTPDYWLDHCTLQEWRTIWHRELIEQPPAEAFLANYFDYSPPGTVADEADEPEEITFDLRDCEV